MVTARDTFFDPNFRAISSFCVCTLYNTPGNHYGICRLNGTKSLLLVESFNMTNPLLIYPHKATTWLRMKHRTSAILLDSGLDVTGSWNRSRQGGTSRPPHATNS
jgi:hypothetical protein